MWHISNEWACGIALSVRLNLASNIRLALILSNKTLIQSLSLSLLNLSITDTPPQPPSISSFLSSFKTLDAESPPQELNRPCATTLGEARASRSRG
ncbi:hypothetical protein HanXRQr2_Chr07g0316391 [Helianthus annuus]|uniref:Uncharacterized protein n=1 Tax=Helianthus annuus TaxID=4232 RepID=A0A251UH97_HELAN|nr:hypothetical protein HanXRQr2_Chr07g0316391 [Helianthus annuus]KAJ0906462.1 hypothetical protein HanPSC8_Chr07g0305661 [Helianthus annuus]